MHEGSLGARLRGRRAAAGLSQGQLAAQAGISRQMVGAIEAGRHLPRVDAGVALARALGVTVESLLEREATAVVAVTGELAEAGLVRLGQVGAQLVCAPVPTGEEGWSPADGVVRGGTVELLPGARPGAVVAGCDPAIGLAARLVTSRGGGPVLAVSASTGAAIQALAGGRSHAAVVHGPPESLPAAPAAVRRWHLARWQVGLAADPDLPDGWARTALDGRADVVQRERGAGSQQAFQRALETAGAALPVGPVARGHLDAAILARAQGIAAVTIEPVAVATGMAFHPLETHAAQLWVAARWAGEPGIGLLVEAVASTAFQAQLAAVGGYDLAGCGAAVAA